MACIGEMHMTPSEKPAKTNATSLDLVSTEAAIAQLMAQTFRLNAETAKMRYESAWAPAITMAGAIAAAAAIIKLLT